MFPLTNQGVPGPDKGTDCPQVQSPGLEPSLPVSIGHVPLAKPPSDTPISAPGDVGATGSCCGTQTYCLSPFKEIFRIGRSIETESKKWSPRDEEKRSLGGE